MPPMRLKSNIEPLPGVSNAEDALKPGAPLAREELDSNICYTMSKNGGNVDKAFAEADHVFTMHIASPRQVALAMEPRGIVASPDPFGKNLTVWLSTQGPIAPAPKSPIPSAFPNTKFISSRPTSAAASAARGRSTARILSPAISRLNCASR